MPDLEIAAAEAGLGIVASFDEYLRTSLDAGRLKPVLQDWWMRFSGPRLYYAGNRLTPAPLRAFIDFIKTGAGAKKSGLPIATIPGLSD